jgi:hypothetical protein
MTDRFENLSRLLETRSPIEFDGTPYAVWLIECRDSRSSGAQSVDVLVGARSQSQTHTGEVRLTRDRYTDAEINELAVDLTKRIVRGELPPGRRELL